MNRTAEWSSKGILYLTASLFYAAALLRAAVDYWTSPALYPILGILVAWLVLFVGEPIVSQRRRWYFPPYLVLQSALALGLLSMSNTRDYFAILFSLLSMQTMQRFDVKPASICIALFTLLMTVPLLITYGLFDGIAFVLVYMAADVLLGFYGLATRRAQAAHAQNQALAQELEQANRQLEEYSVQREKLAAMRERQRLARELHDAATQTIFSMTLATQSALILLDRDPSRVGAQLERVNQLATSALSEIRTLISELRPDASSKGGLVSAVREHLAKGHFAETLAVSLDVEGEQTLTPAEDQGLFRILQEALNNIVKHAHATHVGIHLHLCDPFWIEIQDDGCGFELGQVTKPGQVGLHSMRERAAEIGWDLQIITSPGAGTRIRAGRVGAFEKTPLEKMPPDQQPPERQAA